MIIRQFPLLFRIQGKASFIDEAATSIPGRGITDVNAHEAWYQEYTSLQEKKKDAIMKWRAVKEVILCNVIYQ